MPLDCLLGRTEVKRNSEQQQVIYSALEEHYNLIRAMGMLDGRDTGLIWALIENMLEDRL